MSYREKKNLKMGGCKTQVVEEEKNRFKE